MGETDWEGNWVFFWWAGPCWVQFSSVQSLSSVWLFATPWIVARQASLSLTNTQSSLGLTSIESMMPSSHLFLCRPLLLLPPIPPSMRVFSNESTLHMRWPKYWSFSFSIIPSKEIPGLISFRMDWLDLLSLDMVFLWYSPFQWLEQPFNQLGKPEFKNTFDMSFSFSLSIPWITESCLFIVCQIKCPKIRATALIYSPMASHWITVIASKQDFPILLLDSL